MCLSARVCEGFAEDEPEEGVDRASSAFAACASLGFAGGISVCFTEESVVEELRDEGALDEELVDDDALGVELAQNGRQLDAPSSSLCDFLRLSRFLHSSTRAL